MIQINKTSAVNDGFLIFEFQIDDNIPLEFIKDESNYMQIKAESRNGFSFESMQSIELKSLMESFSDENLYKIIDEIYQSNKFNFGMSWILNEKKYSSMYDFIKKNTNINTHIFMDSPGFGFAPHFDNRFVFANFIVNLDDNPISTKFYDYRKNSKLIYEAPKEKGTGVFFLNYENSFHSYMNDTNINRYAMMSSITINLA
jgi:hypothetical protein